MADGHLGGCQWTKQMSAYIGPIKTSGKADRKRWLLVHWWYHPLCESELRAFFSQDAVDIVLAIHRDGMDWHQAATQWERSIAWISQQNDNLTAHMRRVIMNASFR